MSPWSPNVRVKSNTNVPLQMEKNCNLPLYPNDLWPNSAQYCYWFPHEFEIRRPSTLSWMIGWRSYSYKWLTKHDCIKVFLFNCLTVKKYEPFWKIYFSFHFVLYFFLSFVCLILLLQYLLLFCYFGLYSIIQIILNNNIFQLVLRRDKLLIFLLALKLPDQICHSPYCQPYNSYNVSSENLVLDRLIITKLIFYFILITCLVNTVIIL